MTINNKKITAKEFGYDNCHKIYLVNTAKDREELEIYNYEFFPISELESKWNYSCDLKFISNADLETPNIVNQFEEARFV